MAPPALELDGLIKRFAQDVVIGPVSLALATGEFLSLLGPSGCGKTTVLRCIAGFERPDAGDVRIAGRPILGDPPNRRRVGFVFQNYALFPHLTVADNIAFGLRRHGAGRAEVTRRVGEMLERVGLEGLGRRRPSELSGGQQQRVALARVLVLDPAVLLLDEPLSNLDRKLRVQMRAELRRVHREFGKTVVYVTHDQEEALSLSDRIGVMLGSAVAQLGPPTEIYERPRSAAVADFIGECNLYAGKVDAVSADGGVAEVVTPAGTRWRVRPGDGPLSPGGAVHVLIRPDRVHPGPPAAAVVACTFEVRLTDRSYGGERVTLTGVLPSGDPVQLSVAPGASAASQPLGTCLLCHVTVDEALVVGRRN